MMGLCLLALLLSAFWGPLGALRSLENHYYDARLRLLMPQSQFDAVVIVDVDEQSLAEQGQWPWAPTQIADLVDGVFAQGAVALGMDMVFAETKSNTTLQALQALHKQGAGPRVGRLVKELEDMNHLLTGGERLSQSLSDNPVVLGYYFSSDKNSRRSGQLPDPVLPGAAAGPQHATSWDGYGANVSEYAQAAISAGFFNALLSEDGLVRAVPLLAEFEGDYYESLPLAMLRMASNNPELSLPSVPGMAAPQAVGLRYAHGGDSARALVPTDERLALLVPFRGRGGAEGGSFRYYSASDVMAGRLATNAFDGKLVLLGSTAPGLFDLRATPVGEAYPGVEIHANVLAGLMEGKLPYRPYFAALYEWGLLVGLGLGLMWLSLRTGVAAMLVVSSTLAVVLWGLNTALFVHWHWVLPAVSIFLLLLFYTLIHIICSYAMSLRSRSELTHLFGTYVPPELVEEMVKSPGSFGMEAHNRELTVMFCDVRGFTELAEGTDPLLVQQLLNSVFAHLTAIISKHNGTIDKYMGDCVMAFWGAPLSFSNHASLAVTAATEIIALLPQLNSQLRQQRLLLQGQADLDLGIAISTGTMCVGNMGTELRQAYTVIGDDVNLAARLEALGKTYSTSIVVSAKTRLAATAWAWQELDEVRVRGRLSSERIFAPLCLLRDLTPALADELKMWQEFLHLMREEDLYQARGFLQLLTQAHPHHPLYRLYEQRLQKRIADLERGMFVTTGEFTSSSPMSLFQ